ncbi:MAG TPA: hypothetical protein VJM09_12805 [Sphingobium sp.]|nr:hypothetical protein [Sphingobium sp.]
MSDNVKPSELGFLFREQFQRSKVERGTQVVLVTDANTPKDYVEASFAAAASLEANIFEVKVANPFNQAIISSGGGGGDVISATPGLIQAIYSADLVVAFHTALGAPWLQEGRRRGLRFLLITDGPDQLKRLLPPPGLKEAVKNLEAITKAAREFRATSPYGTDFYCKLGQLGVESQWGAADEPGHVDNWCASTSAFWPDVDSSEGTIMLVPGDGWVLPYIRFFESPVELTIEKGYIRKIKGEGTDARLMEMFLKSHQKSPDDLEPYAISHLGFAVHPNSALDCLAVHPHDMFRIASDSRSMPGVFLFSTGPNDQGGGSNSTLAHIDLPMFNCTLKYDDQVLVQDGVIVDERLIVRPSQSALLV